MNRQRQTLKPLKTLGFPFVLIIPEGHSFATYLWDNCGDIYEVKNILGHSSIKTTERYVHASLQRQKMVLTTAHPRQYLTVHTVSSSGPTLAALPKPPVFDIAPNKE